MVVVVVVLSLVLLVVSFELVELGRSVRPHQLTVLVIYLQEKSGGWGGWGGWG